MASRKQGIDYESLTDNELIEITNTHSSNIVRDEARNTAILRREKQVNDAAYRHLKWANSCDIEDLKQEAWRGVFKAIENFDPDFGVPFFKYAFRWCDAYVRYAIYSKGRVIKTPVPVIRAIAKIKKSKAELKEKLGRLPTITELSKATRFTEKKITKFMQADSTIFSISSAENKNNDDSGSFELPAHNHINPYQFSVIFEAQEIRDKILNEVLSERDSYIIKSRFCFDNHDKKTLEGLAEELNMTRMGVLQIQRRSLKKITDCYEKYSETGEFNL